MSVNKVPTSVKKKPRGGSRKGCPNKATKALKEMILGALDAKGGQKWLEKQMDENPSAMLTLLGKVLPQDINAKVATTALTPEQADRVVDGE